ncbi:MAG: hypothetical protein BSK19_06180 [Stenotrophomonas maltophilia]|nr:MAG: hypothetical protein BSK19_06180 [Stenotrophomonas maltophilia]
MAIDKVCVRPGMLPATISVAPNSPIARANASSRPARIPRHASGRVMRKNTAASDTPSVRAACSNWPSTSSNAARAGLNTSGNDATAAAITAACQVNTRLMPNHDCNQAPIGPLRPISTSR